MICNARSTTRCAGAACAPKQRVIKEAVVRFDIGQSELNLLQPCLGAQASKNIGQLAALVQAIANLDYIPMDDGACHRVATNLADLIDYARLAGIKVAPISITCAALLLEYRVPQLPALDTIARFEGSSTAFAAYPVLQLSTAWVVLGVKSD